MGGYGKEIYLSGNESDAQVEPVLPIKARQSDTSFTERYLGGGDAIGKSFQESDVRSRCDHALNTALDQRPRTLFSGHVGGIFGTTIG